MNEFRNWSCRLFNELLKYAKSFGKCVGISNFVPHEVLQFANVHLSPHSLQWNRHISTSLRPCWCPLHVDSSLCQYSDGAVLLEQRNTAPLCSSLASGWRKNRRCNLYDTWTQNVSVKMSFFCDMTGFRNTFLREHLRYILWHSDESTKAATFLPILILWQAFEHFGIESDKN